MDKKHKLSKWTEWTEVGIIDAMYKTNFKKVRVRLTSDNIVAESCCCKDDTFNLSFGIRIAYLRCLVKALEKSKSKCEDANEIKNVDGAITAIETSIKEMIDSLD